MKQIAQWSDQRTVTQAPYPVKNATKRDGPARATRASFIDFKCLLYASLPLHAAWRMGVTSGINISWTAAGQDSRAPQYESVNFQKDRTPTRPFTCPSLYLYKVEFSISFVTFSARFLRSNGSSCYGSWRVAVIKPQAPTPQAPIRNRQTRKVANARGLKRNTNLN